NGIASSAQRDLCSAPSLVLQICFMNHDLGIANHESRIARVLAVRWAAVATLRAVGRSLPRKEGLAKVTGASRYVDDLVFPGMLYGRTIRSSIPCGDITSIRYDFDTAGFTIVDYRDIPGRNVVPLIQYDHPCLQDRAV